MSFRDVLTFINDNELNKVSALIWTILPSERATSTLHVVVLDANWFLADSTLNSSVSMRHRPLHVYGLLSHSNGRGLHRSLYEMNSWSRISTNLE